MNRCVYLSFVLLTVSASAPLAQIGMQPAVDSALCAALQRSGGVFDDEVKNLFFDSRRAEAEVVLATRKVVLPADFLDWVDSDLIARATVYGSRMNAADVLCVLYSLELDLGAPIVRTEHLQLALALSVVHAHQGANLDLSPRRPLQLVISGDPRQRVDTKASDRPLDLNDHIINFLEDHEPVEEDVVIGHREVLPELKYDEKGVAIPQPKAKPFREPVLEKRKRQLAAHDVFASRALQVEFNDYMRARGLDVSIDCGDGIIHPMRREMIRGPEAKGILAAYKLFRAAYEAKGRLPAARDPAPTPSEKMAFLIRNDVHVFPDDVADARKWPRFPLKSPWPVLTLLAADNQSLREREDIWARFRDRGEFRTYGEYIGGIAQQFDFQSARRLAPHDFTYGTYQMMIKDGGVCGTMANIAVRTYNTLGIPSCTAGQPGHCALILMTRDPKTGAYAVKGGQYATGGDDKTSPHGAWPFGDSEGRRGMAHHQSTAWAVNAGFPEYLESLSAHLLFRSLPENLRSRHGGALLEGALRLNPFNILAAESAFDAAGSPSEVIRVWSVLTGEVQRVSARPGCPADSLYRTAMHSRMQARISKLAAPPDPAEAARVLAFLEAQPAGSPSALLRYHLHVHGMESLTARIDAAVRAHLSERVRASRADDDACARLAALVQAATDLEPDRKLRKAWAGALLDHFNGREKYFGHKNRVATDAALTALAKISGRKLPGEDALMQGLLDRLAGEVKTSVEGPRDLKACRALSERITAAAKTLPDDARRATCDDARRATWGSSLATLIKDRETFLPANAKKGAKPVRDPCADAIHALGGN